MLTIRRRGFPEEIKVLTEAQPKRQLVRVVRDVTSRLGVYVSSITPVDTGAMRDSWTWTTVGLGGQVYISLSAYNPRSKLPVIEYASYVDERVGLVDAAMAQGERIAFEAMEEIVWEPR